MDLELYREHDELADVHWWFVGRRRILRALLHQFLGPRQPDRRLLDIGCGPGGMLAVLGEFGEVVGVEANVAAARRAAQRTACRVDVSGLPGPLPFEDSSFDAVSAFDVIEHVDDDRAAVRELYRLLRPGGLMFCTVPAFQWLWSAHDTRNGHHRRYTRRQLIGVLEENDFFPEKVSYFKTVFLPVMVLARFASRFATPPPSDFWLPPAPANLIFGWAFAAERWIVARGGLPIGGSLLAVARRPVCV
jgi:SAM-dependent methyltransferase